MDLPYFISPAIIWVVWTFGLFPIFGYYEKCCYERLCTRFLCRHMFLFLLCTCLEVELLGQW